jgi:hypothetical protein
MRLKGSNHGSGVKFLRFYLKGLSLEMDIFCTFFLIAC